MKPCDCRDRHVPRRVVLTGGPGAGKTAVLELIRLFFCEHVKTLPEAAGIVFGGRFPRSDSPPLRQAAQRAIYHIQRELESVADTENAAVVLCDRGTVDCAAYWTRGGRPLFGRGHHACRLKWRVTTPSSTCAHRRRPTPTIATTRCASSPSRRRRRSMRRSPRSGPSIRAASSWSRRRISCTRPQEPWRC